MRSGKGTGLTALLSLLALLHAGSLAAEVIYSVEDTSVVNCSNAPHGLWTNNDTSGTCGNYYSMQAGSTLTIFNDSADVADWTAELLATAMNPQGVLATINLTFSNFTETNTLKVEGGNAAYNSDPSLFDSTDLAAPDNIDIDFFLDVIGTISFDPDTNLNIASNPVIIDDIVSPFGLQFGFGANAKKSDEFGASAWIQWSTAEGDDHWDLNLNLTAVPEPAPTLILAFGLLGLGYMRRRSYARINA